MNYIAYFFWNHLINVSEERRIVDGKEEVCLIIPTRTNQLKQGKSGNWYSICRLAECPPNARAQTHDIQLTYLSEEEIQKSYNYGYHRRTARLGRVYAHDRTPEKKIDRTNKSTHVNCIGRIILSDIPKSLIFRNDLNDKRYVTGLQFRLADRPNIVFTGTICIDDIPYPDIHTDQNTGKKYINAKFTNLPILDTYMNTHQLVIVKDDGSEIEIWLLYTSPSPRDAAEYGMPS